MEPVAPSTTTLESALLETLEFVNVDVPVRPVKSMP
jgi:hypothetical protein